MTESEIFSKLSLFSRDGAIYSIPYSSAVFALGTFDGVHIAHQALIKSAQELKERTCADALAVWCFSESPATVLGKAPREVLTDRHDKIRLLLEYGADVVVMADFSDFCDMSAEDFVSEVLISALSCKGTVCGFDHRFGKGGLGNFELLRSRFGNDLAVSVSKITIGGETVSSSAVRALVSSGDMEGAKRMLGRPISITSAVMGGKQLGRKLGFPTANQRFPDGFVNLRHGVYATRCYIGGEVYYGVSNVGIRPSIGEGDDHLPNCETYLIDFSGDIYGQVMTVEFYRHIRDEIKFSSLEELTSAIRQDTEIVTEYFEKESMSIK